MMTVPPFPLGNRSALSIDVSVVLFPLSSINLIANSTSGITLLVAYSFSAAGFLAFLTNILFK